MPNPYVENSVYVEQGRRKRLAWQKKEGIESTEAKETVRLRKPLKRRKKTCTKREMCNNQRSTTALPKNLPNFNR